MVKIALEKATVENEKKDRICCYLSCAQKVNMVLHLHSNWLVRSWTGDITVFRVAVLANVLREVLSTLV